MISISLWFLALSIIMIYMYKCTKKPHRFPPGPPRFPMIGSLPFIATKTNPTEPRSLLSGMRQGKNNLRIVIKNFTQLKC